MFYTQSCFTVETNVKRAGNASAERATRAGLRWEARDPRRSDLQNLMS
jgi:hypothetical protein